MEWAWLRRYPWFGEERDTPLPVIVAQMRVALKLGDSFWDTRDRLVDLENRVTTLELDRGFPEEEGR